MKARNPMIPAAIPITEPMSEASQFFPFIPYGKYFLGIYVSALIMTLIANRYKG